MRRKWQTPVLVVAFATVARAAPAAPVTRSPHLAPGSTYHLVFVTAGIRDAASANIADYDAFVTSQANLEPGLARLNTTWKVIGSTNAVSALDHLGPLTAPIYNTAGQLVATSSADLFDGTLAAPVAYTQFGIGVQLPAVFTGTRANGLACVCYPGNCCCGGPAFGDRTLGSQLVQRGDAFRTDARWIASEVFITGMPASFYAISGLLTVPEVPGTFVKIAPADGSVGHSDHPTLSWTGSSGATRYEYCVDSTDDETCGDWISTGPNASVRSDGLGRGGTYYWQVRAVNAAGVTYANGIETSFWRFSTSAETAIGDVRLKGDVDGDGRSDLTVYRPSSGEWFMRTSSSGYDPAAGNWFQWGLVGDMPLLADFDGDARADITVYRPTTGEWFIRNSSAGYDPGVGYWFQWGLPGDKPVATDFDADGRTDIAVYRPSSGMWFIRYSGASYDVGIGQWFYQWGLPGDEPVAVDFDGDHRTDLAVYRPGTGEWFVRRSGDGYAVGVGNWYYQWGLVDDRPVAADFDGDGKADIAVYRPSNGLWHLRYSSLGYAVGAGNWAFNWGQTDLWGLVGDVPKLEDFDGDGKVDIAVYRPTSGEWLIRYSSLDYEIGRGNWQLQWGLVGDISLPTN